MKPQVLENASTNLQRRKTEVRKTQVPRNTVIQLNKSQVAQLSLTNPRDVLRHGKRQNFETVT